MRGVVELLMEVASEFQSCVQGIGGHGAGVDVGEACWAAVGEEMRSNLRADYAVQSS